MSEYGMLQEVRIVYRGSTLTAAAGIGDTELQVDYAGDFNNDPDDPDNSGGTLDLNGARLGYTSVTYGELIDDPDTILLAAPLEVAADVDDFVGAVAGGMIGEDWEAHVTMGEGDRIVALLTVDQRSQWPVGVYDDPVPVVLSDGLPWRIEDAPGRTVSSRVAFWTDTQAAEGPGELPITLTHTPLYIIGVHWGPLFVPLSDWSLDGKVLTVADADSAIALEDVATVVYAYDEGASDIAPASTIPVAAEVSFGATGWKWLQIDSADATDYSSTSFDDSGWDVAQAPFGETNPAHTQFTSWLPYVTIWEQNTRMWARREVAANPGDSLTISLRWNRAIDVYWNGVHQYTDGSVAGEHDLEIAADDVLSSNTLAIRATDDSFSGSGTGCYFDARVVQ